MKIKFKLFLLFLIITTIPLFFIAVIIYYNAENYLSDAIIKNLNSIADLKINKIELFFDDIKTGLETAQGYYNIKKNLPILEKFFNDKSSQDFKASKEQLDGQMKVLQNAKGFKSVMFSDADGKIVYSSNAEIDNIYFGHFINDISPGIFEASKDKIYFGNLHEHNGTGVESLKNRLELLAVAPVSDFNGKFIGEIFFEIDMDLIYNSISVISSGYNTEETVIGKKINGKEIIIMNPLLFDKNAALNKKISIGDKFAIPLQKAVNGENGSGSSIDYRSVEVLADWRYLPDLGWGIVSKIDTKEAFSPINNLRDIIILLVFIDFFAVMLIVFAVSKSISDPIEKLQKGTEIIAAGNLDYRVGVSTGDEVGRLSLAFDKMAAQLKDLYENLEKKVKEKTTDLQKLNRALLTISEANEAAIKAVDEKKLLEDVCKILVKNAGYRMAWVGYKVENENKDVKVIASAGYDDGYLDRVNVTWANTERGKGPTGTSIREGKIIAFPNFEKEVKFKPWLNDALKRGYKGSIAFPLFVNNDVIGSVSIYSSTVDAFTPDEVKVLNELSGDLSFSIESIRNRSEKEKIEKELKEAQRMGRFGNFDWDMVTDTIKWSDEYYHIYGFDPKQKPPKYKEYLKVYSAESAARLDEAIKRSMKTGEPYMIDLEQIRPDGIKKWITECGEVKRDKNNKIIGLRGTVQDITERKNAEIALQERTEDLKKFQLAVESTDNHIIITNPDGVIIYANKAAEKITGYSINEMIGKRPSLWGNQMGPEFYKNMWRIIKEDKRPFTGEVKNVRKNGQEYFADVYISPILDEDKNIKFFVGIERDITEEKKMNQTKNEFVSIASHQLRTPLTGIKWVIERFLKTEKPTAKGKEYLEDIHVSMERLSLLVNDLLNFSRIEEKNIKVSMAKFDLNDFIKSNLKEWEALFEKKKIKVEFAGLSEEFVVETDKNILGNIFQCLISNAIEYTPEGGEIKISLDKKDKNFEIKVSDTGIGIPKNEQDKIFKKFIRASNARLLKPDGTGIGLYVAKQSARLLNGDISFKSDENKGTSFIVELPFTALANEKNSGFYE